MRLRNFFLICATFLARCSSTSGDIGKIPAKPEAGVSPTTTVTTFAMDSIALGEAARGDAPTSDAAWKAFGYDLDGLTTTETSTDVCILAFRAPRSYQTDGIDGIDNSWGATLLPILQTPSLSTPSGLANAVIDAVRWTLELEITGLTRTAMA